MATASVKATQILTRTEQAGPQGVGDRIVFTLVTDTPVVVEGRPQLTLSSGGLATYSGVDAQDRPEFTYTVAAGQNAAGLSVTGLKTSAGTLTVGEVRLTPQGTVAFGSYIYSVVAADLNGDGNLDLLTKNEDSAPVRFGAGDGTFTEGPAAWTLDGKERSGWPLKTADFNGDGEVDIAIPVYKERGFVIRLGVGDGTFVDAPTPFIAGQSSPLFPDFGDIDYQIADINNDGKSDIVFTRRDYSSWDLSPDEIRTEVLLGNGDGTFVSRGVVVEPTNESVQVKDVNGDGTADLLSYNSNTIEVRLGLGDGTFNKVGAFKLSQYRDQIGVFDVNGDGRLDVVESRVWLGNGNGTFTKKSGEVFGEFSTGEIQFADLDGDGHVDLVARVANDSKSIQVSLGKGDGTFGRFQTFKLSDAVVATTIADVDGDGRPDVLVVQPDGRVTVLNNNSITPAAFDAGSVATAPGSATGLAVDGTAPFVRSVAVSGPGLKDGTGTLVTGQTATLTLAMSEAVTLTNAATLVLNLTGGGTARYDAAASSATQLVFRYTVGLQQLADDLAVQGVTLNGAVIRDAADNTASLSGAVGNPPGSLRIDGNTGTAGADVFTLKSGAQTYRGLAGDDTYVVSGADDLVFEAVGQGFDTVIAKSSYTLAAGQEIEVLEGGGASLRLAGNAFRQKILGTSGNDELVGKGGGDTLVGRQGDDLYFVRDTSDRVYEAKGGGFDTVRSSGDHRLLAGQEVELLAATDEAAATVLRLTGNEFGQTLRGTAGANVLDGGGGIDALIGLGGDDTYIVDNAGDVVIERSGQGNDTILAGVSYALAAGRSIETLQLLGSTGGKALNLTGNEFGQTLRGNAGANVLDGQGGADTLYGGAGNDTYRVDTVKDRVFEAKGQGADTVVTTTSFALAAGQEIETLRLASETQFKNFNLSGNEFGQKLTGNAGDNVLDGKSGADVLTGGEGRDAFVFSTALGAGNVDRIADFAPVDDGIRLAKSVFAGLAPGPVAAAAFKDTGAAGAGVDADDRILYDSKSGALSYDADGRGKAAAVTFAVLDNKAFLTHHDLFVV